jgi:DNA-binding transcriptional regulator YhcF (GntR family)
MNTVHASPDVAQQEPRTARVPSVPDIPKRSGFGLASREVIRDTRVSPTARCLWVILDDRQGQRLENQISRKVLATDLGVSLSTTKRALAELVSAGLVSPRRSGRATLYTVHNPARNRSQVDSQDAQKDQERTVRWLTSEPSTKQEVMRKKKASKQVPARGTEGLELEPFAAAARTQELADALPSFNPLEMEAFLCALPAHLRPDENAKVVRALTAALDRGWTATGIGQAVARKITNPQATPGLVVKLLEPLSQQPPSEHSERPRPVRYDPIHECHHGKLKVYGGCKGCAAERAQKAPTEARERITA